MKQNLATVPAMRIHFFAFLAVFGLHPGVQAFKVSETPPPVNISASSSSKVVKKVEELMEKNLLHDAGEVNEIPEPDTPKQDKDSANGDLARNLEFLLMKVAQLETVVELQQAEFAAQQEEIESLKKHVGLDAQHVAMARKRARDPYVAKDHLERILGKHHRQRETREYHPEPHEDVVPEPAAEASPEPDYSKEESLLQRQARQKVESTEQSLDESVSGKFIQQIVDAGSSLVNTAVDAVDGTGLTGDDLKNAFNKVKDKGKAVEFIAKTTIDTVDKATVILMNFKGFKFSSDCKPRKPSLSLSGRNLKVGFGGLDCKVTLVGQTITLFNHDFGSKDVTFPDPLEVLPWQIKRVAGASAEAIERLMVMIHDLLNTAGCNRADTFHCMAQRVASYVMQFQPPLNWLPQQVKSVAGASQEAVTRLFSFIHDLLNNPACNRGDTFHCIAQRVATYVMQFQPPLNWLPQQVKSVAGASQEAVNRLFSLIHDLLNTAHCNRGDTFHCMAKRVSTYVMQFEPPVNFMPEPVQMLARAQVNQWKSMLTLGDEMMNCKNTQQGQELIECLGFKILERTAPLSFLNQMDQVLTETIEVFAKMASLMIEKLFKGQESLIQVAATSKFPAAGEAPVVHHTGKNLVIKTHSQRPSANLLQVTASGRGGAEDGGPDNVVKFAVGTEGPMTRSLITQFNGRETSTGSCLAFAPQQKTGSDNQATAEDWQAENADAFVKLEPYAVPCGNTWMKDHWNKWQGYSFYTSDAAIEKCVTVSFSFSAQPVLAFVAGVQFDILPGPLFQLDTQVCWPTHQPGGVDLSVLRSVLKTSGYVLFTRTLRLAQRFGGNTDFVNENINGATQTWRSQFGLSSARGESGTGFESMKRSALLEGNQSQTKAAKADSDTLFWQDEEDMYLASVDYGEDMGVKKTAEFRGPSAAERIALSAVNHSAGAESGQTFKLFSFKHPGMVAFDIEGLLEGNSLQVGVKMAFGPYKSPSRRIELVNIANQFAIVLAGMPFVSGDSKAKAIHALRDFANADVGRVQKPVLRPGSTVAFYSTQWKKYVMLDPNGAMKSSPKVNEEGISADSTWERFTVVDIEGGEIALHHPLHNRFVGLFGEKAGASPHVSAREFQQGWGAEKFKVIAASDGDIALYNPGNNRFLNLRDTGVVGGSGHPPSPSKLPDGWGWERFKAVYVRPYLEPGTTVGLWNGLHRRFLRMNDQKDIDYWPGGQVGPMLPGDWIWEKFTVVDAGYGEVALYCKHHKRFLSMNADNMYASDETEMSLKDGWTWQRFAVVPAPGGKIALHNRAHNRFVQMTEHNVQAKGPNAPQDFEAGWTWEIFHVVQVPDTKAGDPPLAGMVSWFRSEDAEVAWRSAVGSYEAFGSDGVHRKVEAGHGAARPVAYMAGDHGQTYNFGKVLSPTYTVCSVSRYTGAHKKRVLQTELPANWLHGHWHGKAGVCHYGEWNTPHDGSSTTDWVVLCGSNGHKVFDGSKNNIAISNGHGFDREYHLKVNPQDGFKEFSDFGVMEVITWNRVLSDAEMMTTIDYLQKKLKLGTA